ncbi:MAG TPA: dockerin type I domain-containing protein [Phycisphaerae bacterium]|jgi:hypothetical protein
MLRKYLYPAVVAGALAAPATATNFAVIVHSVSGSTQVNAPPGCRIRYRVEGVLSDTQNDGLALWGCDLRLARASDGAVVAGLVPDSTAFGWPMDHFMLNLGATNPTGYGGIVGPTGYPGYQDANILLGLGGAQNTIKNTDLTGFAFPSGVNVVGKIAYGKQILAAGTLDVPNDPGGTYSITPRNVVANVIKTGELAIANAEFYKTGAAGLGTISKLTVVVDALAPVALILANPPIALDNPSAPGTVFRDLLQTGTTSTLTQGIGGSGTPTEGSVQYATISVTFGCAPNPAPTTSNITVTCTDISGTGSADCPNITSVTSLGGNAYQIALDRVIPTRECSTITFNAGNIAGQKVQYQYLPGDVDLNGTTNTGDLSALTRARNNPDITTGNPGPNLAHYDINRDGVIDDADVTRLLQLLNGTNTTEVWNGKTVANCP